MDRLGHQQEQVCDQEWTADSLHVFKKRVVIDPHNPDDEEAEGVPDIAWPFFTQGRPEFCGRVDPGAGNSNIEHEQCNRDCKDTVTKHL